MLNSTLRPYLPITATFIQRKLSSVPMVGKREFVYMANSGSPNTNMVLTSLQISKKKTKDNQTKYSKLPFCGCEILRLFLVPY